MADISLETTAVSGETQHLVRPHNPHFSVAQTRTAQGPLACLSQRERVVFQQLPLGHTNQQVADDLDLSVKTVETYRARLGEKLGLRTRADLIRFAIEAGMLGPGSSGK